jgi:hypothetical protein
MMDYLYQTSDLNLILILCSVSISISVIALFCIKKFYPVHLRYQDNEVIASTSALIIVIYGVLAGFATQSLLNKMAYATDALQHEANAIVNLYRDSLGLEDNYKAQIKKEINQYIDNVLNNDWPLMNKGQQISSEGAHIIERISVDLTHLKIATVLESHVVGHMLTQLKELYDARRARIEASYATLANEIWIVVIAGTVLSLFASYLFGVNFYLHIFIVSVAALMTTSVLFLLISLDKPFQGDSSVGPELIKYAKMMINDE